MFDGKAAGPLLHLLEEDDLKHVKALQRRSFLCGRHLLASCEYQPDLLRDIRYAVNRKWQENLPPAPRNRLSSPYFIFWTNGDVRRWVIEVAREVGVAVKFMESHAACVALHGPFFLDRGFKIGQLTNGLMSVNPNKKLSKQERRQIAKLALGLRIEMQHQMITESFREVETDIADDGMQDVVLDMVNAERADSLSEPGSHDRGRADQALHAILVTYRPNCAEQIGKMSNSLQRFDSMSDGELGISDVVQTVANAVAESEQPTAVDRGILLQSFDTCPPYWRAFSGGLTDHGDDFRQTDVSVETRDSISSLMDTCWKEDETVVGRDSRGINQRRFRIKKIRQIENPKIFLLYRTKCRSLLSSSAIPSARVKTKDKRQLLDQRLLSSINECYLWHGTKPGNVEVICRQGFDPRVGDGMFGHGTYFAEKSSKSNQYVGKSYLDVIQPAV